MSGIKNKKISIDDLSKINGGSSQAESCKVYCYNCKKILGTFNTHDDAENFKESHMSANEGHNCIIRSNSDSLPVMPSMPSK